MIQDSREAKDIGRFIRARRETTQASDYSEIPNRRRHVAHLAQSDLAHLVHVSTVVISQIEQGRYPNLNRSILQRISQVLNFTQQQNIYLLGLLEDRPAEQHSVVSAPKWLIDSIGQISHPVVVVNPAYDLVSINENATALLGSMGPQFAPRRNSAVSIFQLPTVREFIQDWHAYAATLVSGIKMSYAMFPAWRDYIDDLVVRLESTDPHFHQLWSQDDPLVAPTIEKRFNHPELGILDVNQILTDIVEAPGLTRIDFIPADDETRRKFRLMKYTKRT